MSLTATMRERDVGLSEMVAEWMSRNEVTVVQPAAGSGNEQSRATRERVAQARREFRKNARLKAKAAREA
jgi:hypothetical protein